MFAFQASISLFIYIWTTNSETITCESTNNNCINTQYVYTKTHSNDVTFNCNTDSSCEGLIIYFAAPKTLTINCWDESCLNIQVYCGKYDPPEPYSLSDMDVSSNVNCEVRCDSNDETNPPAACVNIYFGCKGNDISNFDCNLNAFAGDQIASSTMECDVQNTVGNTCNVYCDEGCISGSKLLCHSGSECTSTGSISKTTGVTWAPTPSPTTSPTQSTSAPTKTPTISPVSAEPTTNLPTTFMPTTFPTTFMPTTNIPTTFSPTTDGPTTFTPTTDEPTTNMPTTFSPTTTVPTTFPTTFMPTTFAPTTNLPTTFMPTTMEPTTSNPTAIPTTNMPTNTITMNVPTTSTEKDAGQVDDITTNDPVNTNNNAAKSESAFSFGNIIIYLVGLIGVLFLLFICLVAIYVCQKKRMRHSNIQKQATDNINRVDSNMIRVKSASLEMMNIVDGSNGGSGQAIIERENRLSPVSANGLLMPTLGGVTLGGEDQIINAIANSVNNNNDISADTDGTDDTEDDVDDMYRDPMENNNMTKDGNNNDDDSDTPIEPVNALSPSKGNILTSMGNM